MVYKPTKEEMETQLLTNAATREWDFWTYDPAWVSRVQKLGYTVTKDHQGGWSCRIPKDRIRVLRPEKRVMSPEELEKRRRAIALANLARKSSTAIEPAEGENVGAMVGIRGFILGPFSAKELASWQPPR